MNKSFLIMAVIYGLIGVLFPFLILHDGNTTLSFYFLDFNFSKEKVWTSIFLTISYWSFCKEEQAKEEFKLYPFLSILLIYLIIASKNVLTTFSLFEIWVIGHRFKMNKKFNSLKESTYYLVETTLVWSPVLLLIIQNDIFLKVDAFSMGLSIPMLVSISLGLTMKIRSTFFTGIANIERHIYGDFITSYLFLTYLILNIPLAFFKGHQIFFLSYIFFCILFVSITAFLSESKGKKIKSICNYFFLTLFLSLVLLDSSTEILLYAMAMIFLTMNLIYLYFLKRDRNLFEVFVSYLILASIIGIPFSRNHVFLKSLGEGLIMYSKGSLGVLGMLIMIQTFWAYKLKDFLTFDLSLIKKNLLSSYYLIILNILFLIFNFCPSVFLLEGY